MNNERGPQLEEKFYYSIRTTKQASETLKTLAQIRMHDIGDEFMLIMEREWNSHCAQSGHQSTTNEQGQHEKRKAA